MFDTNISNRYCSLLRPLVDSNLVIDDKFLLKAYASFYAYRNSIEFNLEKYSISFKEDENLNEICLNFFRFDISEFIKYVTPFIVADYEAFIVENEGKKEDVLSFIINLLVVKDTMGKYVTSWFSTKAARKEYYEEYLKIVDGLNYKINKIAEKDFKDYVKSVFLSEIDHNLEKIYKGELNSEKDEKLIYQVASIFKNDLRETWLIQKKICEAFYLEGVANAEYMFEYINGSENGYKNKYLTKYQTEYKEYKEENKKFRRENKIEYKNNLPDEYKKYELICGDYNKFPQPENDLKKQYYDSLLDILNVVNSYQFLSALYLYKRTDIYSNKTGVPETNENTQKANNILIECGIIHKLFKSNINRENGTVVIILPSPLLVDKWIEDTSLARFSAIFVLEDTFTMNLMKKYYNDGKGYCNVSFLTIDDLFDKEIENANILVLNTKHLESKYEYFIDFLNSNRFSSLYFLSSDVELSKSDSLINRIGDCDNYHIKDVLFFPGCMNFESPKMKNLIKVDHLANSNNLTNCTISNHVRYTRDVKIRNSNAEDQRTIISDYFFIDSNDVITMDISSFKGLEGLFYCMVHDTCTSLLFSPIF